MTHVITRTINSDLTIALPQKLSARLAQLNTQRHTGHKPHIHTLLHELGEYIAQMRQRMDGQGQAVMFDDALGLLLRDIGHGVWVVVDMWLSPYEEPRPVYGWRRVMDGARELLVRIVSYWLWDRELDSKKRRENLTWVMRNC